MLINPAKLACALLLSGSLLTSCQDYSAESRPQTQLHEEPRNQEPLPNISLLRSVAERAGLEFAHASIHSFLDSSQEGLPALVMESDGARTKYLSYTPVLEFSTDEIIIDCSYVIANDTATETVYVGDFCRTTSMATRDTLEEAIDSETLLHYRPLNEKAFPPISECAQMAILSDYERIVIRCDNNRFGSTTSGITVWIMKDESTPLMKVVGYEFIPIQDRSGFALLSISESGYGLAQGLFSCLEARIAAGVGDGSELLTHSPQAPSDCVGPRNR